MQLIFYYNPNNKSQNQGVNFSPKYDFRVEYIIDESGLPNEGLYTLVADQNWEAKEDIFSDGSIASLSAVVGENGSGKTHILRAILGITPYDELEDLVEHNKREQYLFIVRKEKRLYLYHKIEQGIFKIDNNTKKLFSSSYDTSFKSGKNETRKDVAIKGVFEKTSIIYFTSSFYEKWASGISSMGKIKTAMISPAADNTWASAYFETIINHNNKFNTVDEYYYWMKILKAYNVVSGFQRIMDLRFYKKMEDDHVNDNVNTSLFQRLQDGFKIRLVPIYGVLSDRSVDYFNYKAEKNPWERDKSIALKDLTEEAFEEHIYWNGKIIERLYANLSEEDKFSRYIYYNLLFELCIDKGEEIPDSINSVDDAIHYIKTEAENEENKHKLRSIGYYQNALKEIEELVAISKCCDRVQNIYDPKDISYDRTMKFLRGTNGYKEFLDLMEKSYQSQNSFLIKYIRLVQNDLSTGQRCLQNFASWLYLLPEIQHIKGNNIERLDDNIILLIDEIDLYLHPEWQRRIVYEIIEELKHIFSESEKKIQIIVTTHSPLCLSDVPSENTAYLYRDNNGFHVKDRKTTSQSFGREIYQIYKDSFFLDNTMGEYASRYIRNLLQEIDSLRERMTKRKDMDGADLEVFIGKFYSIEERCKIVGNGILKEHMKRMLDWIKLDVRRNTFSQTSDDTE